jgi:enoyl-CoA hydratase/carnithine racemase
VNALDDDDGIECLVVTGAGEKAFSAGGTSRSSCLTTSSTAARSKIGWDTLGGPWISRVAENPSSE